MNAVWVFPFILLGGALQTCGAAMNGQLNKSLANPYLALTVSFLISADRRSRLHNPEMTYSTSNALQSNDRELTKSHHLFIAAT